MLSNRRLVLHAFKAQPCALFVLIALFMPDCPPNVGEKWLARRTGYTRKTVRESGLAFLEDLGLVQRVGYRQGWRLTREAAQLPLPLPELPGVAGAVLEGEAFEDEAFEDEAFDEELFDHEAFEDEGCASEAFGEEAFDSQAHDAGPPNGLPPPAGADGDAPQPPPKARKGKVYPFRPAATATTTTYRRELAAAAVEAPPKGKVYPFKKRKGKVYPFTAKLSTELSTAEKKLSTGQQAVRDYLQRRGIGAPTCERLAQLPWLTLDYARAHLDAGVAEGAAYGLIIHRMKAHDPAPAGGDDAACPDCGRALYDAAGRCRVCSGQIVV